MILTSACTRKESNLRTRLRRPVLYPLSYWCNTGIIHRIPKMGKHFFAYMTAGFDESAAAVGNGDIWSLREVYACISNTLSLRAKRRGTYAPRKHVSTTYFRRAKYPRFARV